MPALDREAIGHLLRNKDFSAARRALRPLVLAAPPVLAPGDLTWARQKLALATYKDSELQTEDALDEALRILGAEDLPATEIPETLNLAGAIHKRVWEITGDQHALRKSRACYGRALKAGRERGALDDWTYSAVNVAFVLDLLAREEEADEGAEFADRARDLRAQADAERNSVCAEKQQMLDGAAIHWWRFATLAEACFGLGDSAAAAALLQDGLHRAVPTPGDWECESTARQLVALARLRFPDEAGYHAAIEALAPLLSEAAARSLLGGKLGLALSGGGFRAALFHCGVLARLAELDLLRHVEVLSCVSGGSILGALYYLELKKELQARPDDATGMRRKIYLDVVGRVIARLETALRNDIRTAGMLRAVVSGFWKRTRLTGALIDKALYATPGAAALTMRDLCITPAGAGRDFNPKLHNWRRAAKVPILILNATTLNTGHNWQFAATWMGEAPTCIEPAIDASERLRRFYYTEDNAPPRYRDFLLRDAVAASAAVPGLFVPIVLRNLYQGDPAVRLADGGVNDNQGVFGLMEQDCNVMIISDGCGQLPVRVAPNWMALGVLPRASDVLMDVVRRNAYRILALRFRTRRLRDLRYFHLKQGLPTRDVTWIGGAAADSDALVDIAGGPGLNERAQRATAAIRTDLDRFSRTECDALMYAGYRITERNLNQRPFALADAGAPRDEWSFLRAASWMDAGAWCPPEALRELECGRHRFFRRARLFWSSMPWTRWSRA